MGVELIQDLDSRDKLEMLFSDDPHKCLDAVMHLKNMAIGSNKQKGVIIENNFVPRLLAILNDERSSDQLKVQTGLTLCSLAKGTDDHIKKLVDVGTVRLLLMIAIQNRNKSADAARLTDACLRCLRSIFASPHCPINQLYEIHPAIPQLLNLLDQPDITIVERECIANIFAAACQTMEQQNLLANYGAVPRITKLLFSKIYKIQIPALAWMSQMTHRNETVGKSIVSSEYNGKKVTALLVELMSQSQTCEMQLASAKAMTYLCRCGAIPTSESSIGYRTLPTLVRLCKKDQEPQVRAASAETIAYLTEVDVCLQQLASICDQLIRSLAEILKYQSSCITMIPVTSGGGSVSMITPATVLKFEQEVKIAQDMKQAAFKAFASLASNDEEIRKRIIETQGLMENIVTGLTDPNVKIVLAALRCLHSLSRSVQQLRTSFQDHTVWNPLKNLLYGDNDEILTVASSTLCNLLLEFSPSKQILVDKNLVDLLCGLTKRDEAVLRLNGVWALMNMSFQTETKMKMDIITSLGIAHILRLLNDQDPSVTMKTLGLLRNLLSNKADIDQIIAMHGKIIICAVGSVLEGDSPELKEQALCTFANIADGEMGKEMLMSNEDILKRILSHLKNPDTKLQIAATYCISNLAWSEEAGARERQEKLKDLGAQKFLQQLNNSNDSNLAEKVKMALQQFN